MEKSKILRAFVDKKNKIVFCCNNRWYKEMKDYLIQAEKDGCKWISMSQKELNEQYKGEENALFE